MPRNVKHEPTAVRVLAKHIRAGVAGDCYRCAMALALQDAFGDDHANVYERDWQMWLQVGASHILAPLEVREFVWAYDDLERNEGKRPVLPKRLKELPEQLRPFTFTLPPDDSPEWQERCYQCEELFPPAELDDEGCCPECHEET